MYAIIVDFWPMVRNWGHTGILLSHYAFDGGLCDQQSRLARRRHRLWYHRCDDPVLRARVADKNWVVSTLCGDHVCHNSVPWAMKNHYGENKKKDDKDLAIMILSVGNSYHEIVTHHTDLLEVIRWDDPPEDRDVVVQWWNMIGLSPVLVELCTDLNIRWDFQAEVLCVNRQAQQRENPLADISKDVFANKKRDLFHEEIFFYETIIFQ